MKGFSITAVLAVFAAAVLPALAAPIELENNFERDEYITLEERAVSATAQAAITWLGTAANHAAINAKPVCFYSGFTMVTNTKLKPPVDVRVTAHGKLGAFMGDHGCISIDNVMNLAGQSANSKKWTPEDWLEVSRALGKAVSGTVRVLLGTTVPADTVWLKAEKPALLANKGVTSIEHYEIGKDGKITKKANIK